MDSLAALNERLLLICSLLDTSAGEVRDAPLHPVKDNLVHVGTALSEIYDILRAIYAVRPDLRSDGFPERASDQEANKRLSPTLSQAHALAREGKVAEATLLLSQYVESEKSALHRSIAIQERDWLVANALPGQE